MKSCCCCVPWLLGLGLALTACSPPPEADRVVLISIDTLRVDHIGAYGSDAGATPHLDRLAARGVRFETVISPTPLTLPSHTTLLTGLDPPRHGVHDNSVFRLESDVPLLPATLREADIPTAAFVAAVVLDRQYGLARGFDDYDDTMALRLAAGTSGFAERRGDAVVDAAIEWLDTAPDRFFLWVHLYDPHADYDPPPAYAGRFATPYLGEIAFADAQVGRLLRAINTRFESGSLVAVSSDHGESLGEHGEPSHALTIYDATQRVPWILAGPGIPRGRVVSGVARLADVAPTLAARMGKAYGAGYPGGLDGQDLGPFLEAGALPADRIAYVETLATRYTFQWSALFGLRTATWKYLRAPRPELYDLRVDPGETRNRATAEPARAAELDAALDAILASGRSVTANRELGSGERERLAALGYVATDADEADVELGEVSGIDPKDGLIYLASWRQMLALQQAGRPEEALERMRTFRQGGPVLDALRTDLALEAEAFVEAERYARSTLAAGFERASAYLSLGSALLGQRHFEQAEKAFREALVRNPVGAGAHVGLGRIAEANGDLDAARVAYQQAVQSREGSIEAHWRLAALALEAGSDDEANMHLETLPERERFRVAALSRLCEADLEQGDPARAAARILRALELSPGNPQILALRERVASAGDR